MLEIPYSDLEKYRSADLGVTDWMEITQERITGFAELTGDTYWIHVDAERAAREMGSTIAHGLLTLSLMPQFLYELVAYTGISRALNYGYDKVRFTAPVPVGARIRLRAKITNIQPKGAGQQITAEAQVEIEGQDSPACIAEMLTIVFPA